MRIFFGLSEQRFPHPQYVSVTTPPVHHVQHHRGFQISGSRHPCRIFDERFLVTFLGMPDNVCATQ